MMGGKWLTASAVEKTTPIPHKKYAILFITPVKSASLAFACGKRFHGVQEFLNSLSLIKNF
ncbi:MAG: hypothetical protein COV01_01300 [Candidatus Taylorbacteria bacterium CG10_big_fil_rev_8_21_14_0_10_41_48]|uniref:Uncharacterized protein n=1 Tax=Candidatus Taylorbacteria bacterium CG10_big_fil_rev_8_21_14_0_10_41_48 TaxID=1975024 RepID=A0A2M8LCK9_9BACT|nr:MAG: hypothetical protein COV01_01300 [Candidatus Taylorbacteria bacterium CG10_big_fil_rev_8_21_14_0_10_41_48]